jgi:hypothetical protein
MRFAFGKHGVVSALEQSLVPENQERVRCSLDHSTLTSEFKGVSRALTDPAFQSGNVQSNDRRRTTRVQRQLPSKPFHDVAKRTGSNLTTTNSN